MNSPLKEICRPYFRWLYLTLFPDKKPRYFSECWRYPSYDLRSAPPEVRESGDEPDLLFLPMNDWHTRIQRSQQLAMAFTQLGHRCVYFNPHLGYEYPAPYLARRASRLAVVGPRLLEFHTRLPREHVFHGRMPSDSESRRIAGAARELASALGIRRAIQIVSLPIWLDTALALREAFGFPIVYDCHDHLSGFDNIAPDIVAAEPRLIAESDLVTCSSEPLAASIPEARTKALLLRNAVDADHFRRPAATPRDSGKVIGYVGALEGWFDVDAVRTAAEDHPEWKFAIVGRVDDPRIGGLAACPNVSLQGELPYNELPAFLARCDVAMIPFLRTDLTLATNPIKLYEYFSRGLPVVSTRLPEVEQYSDLVYLASNPREFSEQVARAVEENDPGRRGQRIAVAEQESWTARARQLLDAVTCPVPGAT